MRWEIFSELLLGIWRNGRGYCDPDPYASKPAKYKLQVRIMLIDACEKYKWDSYWLMPICLPPYLSYLLWSWNNLNWLVPFIFPFLIPTLITVASWQAILILKFFKLLFENKEPQENGETTVLQTSMHPSQEKFKFFEFFCTQKFQCSLFHIFTHTP